VIGDEVLCIVGPLEGYRGVVVDEVTDDPPLVKVEFPHETVWCNPDWLVTR
jgi:hypothetical protein